MRSAKSIGYRLAEWALHVPPQPYKRPTQEELAENIAKELEAYRREIIQEVREALTSCSRGWGMDEGQFWKNPLDLPILTLEDPLDPRAVAAAEDWYPRVGINDQARKDLARLIDRHFKDSGKGKA